MNQDVRVVDAAQRILREQLQRAPVRKIDIGHSVIAYRRVGSGPDLVFVHGWPLDSRTFRDVAPRLANDFTCHLLDLPGAGESQHRDPAALQLRSHASSVRAVVDELGLRQYALLAHDSGGYAARALAAEDPRVSALVLGNTELPNETPKLVRMLKLLTSVPGGTALLRQVMRSRTLRRSPLGFGGCFRDLSLLDGDFHRLFVSPFLHSKQRSDDTLALLTTLDHELARGLTALHQRIRAPTLLIWGGDDPIFPLPGARAMVSQFAGGAELAVIDGGKAFVHEEEPARFAALAHEFLLRVLRSERSACRVQ